MDYSTVSFTVFFVGMGISILLGLALARLPLSPLAKEWITNLGGVVYCVALLSILWPIILVYVIGSIPGAFWNWFWGSLLGNDKRDRAALERLNKSLEGCGRKFDE